MTEVEELKVISLVENKSWGFKRQLHEMVC